MQDDGLNGDALAGDVILEGQQVVIAMSACDAEGRAAEAAAVKGQFAQIWKNADMPISSSCMCVNGRK